MTPKCFKKWQEKEEKLTRNSNSKGQKGKLKEKYKENMYNKKSKERIG